MKNGLKIISGIAIFVLVLFLSGCRTTITTKVSSTDTELESKLISKSKELIAMDIATEFIIEAQNLVVYNYQEDPKVSYVNISDFITFMKGGIVDLNISKSDVMKISYTYDIPSDYQKFYNESTYTYEMTIDAKSDVISYNDFAMVSNINVPTITQYETELYISDIEIDDNDPSIDIDLSLYNMDIVLFEDEYYMPLYLANLFFTGSNINVYEMKDYIYIIDNFSDIRVLINEFKKDYSISVSDISSHIKDYLALYFDYFYGLKNYKNIDSYITVLDTYNFEEKDSFYSLYREIEKFINSQNDLHTSLISAGYMYLDFKPSVASSNKLSNYITAYTNNKCYGRRSEVSHESYGNKFVIQINAFSLNTKNILKTTMEKAKKYDDIIIDVSCNPGGNLIGVVELLSYMTDEKIPISYINTTTNEKITEYYETTQNAFLDKNFYVYTTEATFSAANLFASIVKDQELGLIVGKKTSGGASTITYTVLPYGVLIVNSSNLTLLNKDGEVIEDGIEVDINYDYPFKWSDLVADLDSIFVNSSDISIDKNIGEDSITYDFDIDSNLEYLKIDYKLSVYDYNTNNLLYEELFSSDNFSFNIDKVEGNDVRKVEVYARFNNKNKAKEEVIYSEIIDDHSDTFDKYTTEIPIDENFKAYSHAENDKDAYKFTVSENGLYRIGLNEDQQLNNHSIYDENGNLLGEGYDFNLEPGVYYLIASIDNIGDYFIKVRKLEDDNTGPTIITLQNGTQHHKLYYDYLNDEESFEFILTEDSMVTLSWNLDLNYTYSIKKSSGEYFTSKSSSIDVNQDITILMPKGTYIVKINDNRALGEINLTTILTTDYFDYSDDKSLESDKYGKLILGINTMEFLTLWDEDIYYIDITEAGPYVFDYNQNLGIVRYINSNGNSNIMYPNYYINLTPGRHFFVFESYNSDINPFIDFEFILVIDLNNGNNMETVNVDQEISIIISSSTDIDYFEFYSSEMKTYKLNTSYYNNECTIFIIDLNGNIIYENRYFYSFYFTVPEGKYIIKIKSEISNQNRLLKFNLLITEYEGEDDALNLLYLPIEDYEVIDNGFINRINGIINYQDDIDVYIIKVKESGNYKGYLYGSYISMYCIDENGNSRNWYDGDLLYLKEGTYYLKISSYFSTGIYSIGYEKVQY